MGIVKITMFAYMIPSEIMVIPSEIMVIPSEIMVIPSEIMVILSEIMVIPSEIMVIPSEIMVIPSEIIISIFFTTSYILYYSFDMHHHCWLTTLYTSEEEDRLSLKERSYRGDT